MKVPVLNGVYTDESPDYRVSYPRNLIPIPQQNGISAGYLRPANGLIKFGDGVGADRGGISWNCVYYRVMGTKLVSIDQNGVSTIIGDVGGTSEVSFDYSFDYLAVASNNNLFLYDGTTLEQVTDADLGTVLDMVWIDGYFMTTDGEFLVITELNDPFSVNPLKYGSSEASPDPIKGLLRLRNEIYAFNRYTIEVFDNVGAENFPFQRVSGAQIERGAIGTHTACVFMETIAFLGSGINEAPAIWLGNNSNSIKISTREIDQIISEYTTSELEQVILESITSDGYLHLYIHLADQTLVYDGRASQVVQQPIWFTLTSSITGKGKYQARNFVWCYDKWLCGNPTSAEHGYLSENTSSHYGNVIGWDFGTTIIYNESRGAIFHELELVGLTGRVPLGANPTVWTQYSKDGTTWSQEKAISAGKQGQRNKRLVWLQQGNMQNIRIQKFKGTSDTHISISSIEVRIEPLNA